MDVSFLPQNGHTNGRLPPVQSAQPVQGIAQLLLEIQTEGYKPALPMWAFGMADGLYMLPIYLFRDIELMRIHPVVRNALRYFKGAIAGATFEGPKGADETPKPISQNPAVADFVMTMCRRFWDRGVPKLQNGYEYGWIAVENVYTEKQGGQQDGLLEWEGCIDFHPFNCFLLTHESRPVGARVTSVVQPWGSTPKSRVDLWFADGAVPAKALWYPHCQRFNPYYGESQLLGAWRPYKRLAGKDAAETVIDAGYYRNGFSGPKVRFPEEDLQAPTGTPNTTQDTSGKPFKYARDYARFMADQAKAGASIGLPSTKYPPEFGGDFKWDYEWPNTHFSGEHVIAYIKYLIKQVREGVGVPNELIEAAETGSGYSGRAIPLEGFLQQQQEIANAMLHLFVTQVVRPLVLYNRQYFEQYGPIDFEVCVANLLETKLKAAMNKGGATPSMQADGQQGQEQGGLPQQPGQEGVTWKPFQGEGGQQGWQSSNGLVRYTQTPPGMLQGQMSLNSQDLSARLLAIARAVAGVAA